MSIGDSCWTSNCPNAIAIIPSSSRPPSIGSACRPPSCAAHELRSADGSPSPPPVAPPSTCRAASGRGAGPAAPSSSGPLPPRLLPWPPWPAWRPRVSRRLRPQQQLGTRLACGRVVAAAGSGTIASSAASWPPAGSPGLHLGSDAALGPGFGFRTPTLVVSLPILMSRLLMMWRKRI